MQPVVAKNDLGPCAGCGVNMDEGEWVVFHGAGTTHAGCVPRGAARTTQTQTQSSGLLFKDGQLEVIERARKAVGVNHLSFDGVSCLGIDVPRLAGQLAKVFELMRDGKFRSLTQIAHATGCLETSASARLRDLRKERFGNHTVVSRQAEGAPGVYEYKLVVNEAKRSEHGQQAA